MYHCWREAKNRMASSEEASKLGATSVDRQEGANSVPQGVGVTRKKGYTADLSINIFCAAIQTQPHTHTHRIS